METRSKKVTKGKTQEFSSSGKISVKYRQVVKVDPSYDPLPSDDLEPIVIINEENHDVGLVANLSESEDEMVEFRNSTSPVINIDTVDQNQVPTVLLEHIPKIEGGIVSDYEPLSSGDEDDDLQNIDMDSDNDSNPDPEVDPFGDINCDPSFSQMPQSPTSNDSATGSHNDVSDNSEKSNLPSSKQLTTLTSYERKILESKLQCGLCLEKQISESELQTHVEICATFQKNRHRFCVLCNKLFSSLQKYRHHAQLRHGIQVAKSRMNAFRCQFCPRLLVSRESLAAHVTASHYEIKTSNIERPYECQDCSSTFSTHSDLSSHMKSHNAEPEFKCPMPNCEKVCKTKGNLKIHFQRMHSPFDVKPFKCEEPNCGKAFKMEFELRKHMFCHSEDRPFPCSLPKCGKTFKNNDQLKKHLKAHDGARRVSRSTECERPFKCQECAKSFCKNYRLTAHVKTHGKKEIEIFKCPEPNCKTTFKYRENIGIHVANIHTNKNAHRFQCPEPGCDQKFKYKETLQTHVRTHTGQERPFKCPHPGCSAAFNRNPRLTSHLKKNHKNMN